MSACGLCNKSINSKHLKTSCFDCQRDFHGSCVKMSKIDIEYLASEGNVWRCEPCSVSRRQSLRLDSQATEGRLTLEDLMKAITGLSNDQKQTIKDFNVSYELINTKLDENTKVLKEQNEKMGEYIEIIDSLRKENKSLKDRLDSLEAKLDEAEQYSRRNCIEIHGVPIINNNVIGAVKDVGKAIEMDISEDMIDVCHAMGKRPNADGPPGIIVKFVRRSDAELMLAKRRKKKQLSTRHLNLPTDNPVYINESLTAARRRLLGMAREARRQNNYKWLWVRGGRIFLKKEDSGPIIHIKSQADLSSI